MDVEGSVSGVFPEISSRELGKQKINRCPCRYSNPSPYKFTSQNFLLDASCLFLDVDLLRVNPVRTLSCHFFEVNICAIALPGQPRAASYHLPCRAVYWNIFLISPVCDTNRVFNPLKAELNPICHLLILLGDLTFMGTCIVLLGAHYILHISRIRINVVKLFLFGGGRGGLVGKRPLGRPRRRRKENNK
jgi:hypothetical protein